MKCSIWMRLLLVVVCACGLLQAPAQKLVSAHNTQPEGDPITHTPDITTDSPAAFPMPNDHTFVTATGGYLDQYLTHNQVLNGKLDFEIPITRLFFHPDIAPTHFRSDGFLTSDAITDVTANGVLPKSVLLQMRVFDVDGSASPCPEVDRVLINDRPLTASGVPVRLSSGDETWSVVGFQVPLELLKFPQAKGNGTAPAPAINKISVLIDELDCVFEDGKTKWAMTVDWGALVFPSTLPRPVVFMHGWSGNAGTFDKFYSSFFKSDGLPATPPKDYNNGISTISAEAALLNADITKATQEFGVDKVNLYAHSRGGLVSRAAIDAGAPVEQLVTFASPHHGVGLTQGTYLSANKVCYIKYQDPKQIADCITSATNELTQAAVRAFNYTDKCRLVFAGKTAMRWADCTPNHTKRSDVTYYSIVSNFDWVMGSFQASTYPWKADAIPYPITYNVDRVIPCSSPFTICHGELAESIDSYCTAMKFTLGKLSVICSLNSANTTAQAQPAAEQATAPILPDSSYVIARQASISQPVASTSVITTSIDSSVQQALFGVWANNAPPPTYWLESPNGQVFSPTQLLSGTAYATTTVAANVYLYQYSVVSPTVGIWTMRITSNSPGSLVAVVSVKSNIQLLSSIQKRFYPFNTPMTVAVALHDNAAPVLGGTFGAVWRQPNGSTTNLVFADSGSNGDTTANDGVFTAPLNTGTAEGRHDLAITGTKANLVRVIDSEFFVTGTSAQIGSNARTTVTDTNGNGLYDQLNIALPITVSKLAHYDVHASLIDFTNGVVAQAIYSSRSAGSMLPAGVGTTVTLSFPGSAIYANRRHAPYTLTNVRVYESAENSTPQVVTANDVYQTPQIRYDAFEGTLLTLSGLRSEVLDRNQNNRYDELRFGFTLLSHNTSNYTITAQLVDVNGNEIGWSQTEDYTGGGAPKEFVLVFRGGSIGRRNANGPYELRDLSVVGTDAAAGFAYLPLAFTTPAYTFTQFEEGWQKRFYLPRVAQK